MSAADALPVALLAGMGLLWMYVNLKTIRTSSLKTLSLVLMWGFLLASTALAVRIAWGGAS